MVDINEIQKNCNYCTARKTFTSIILFCEVYKMPCETAIKINACNELKKYKAEKGSRGADQNRPEQTKDNNLYFKDYFKGYCPYTNIKCDNFNCSECKTEKAERQFLEEMEEIKIDYS